MFDPMGSLVGAALELSAWASVLTTMNSTPSRPKLIIVFTALPPEPPTPTTLMRASYCWDSSANSIEKLIDIPPVGDRYRGVPSREPNSLFRLVGYLDTRLRTLL